MAEYLIQDTTLTAIADAIRSKSGKTDAIPVTSLASEIASISSGGDEINFEIVGGTTQPSNPKENTIWVNTSNEITSWIFSSTEPTEISDGMVWFGIGTNSNIAFNALKNNDLQVYPISAKQYINGSFTSVTVMSYQGGEWVELQFWDGELYDAGNEYIAVTGGWYARGLKVPGTQFNAGAPSLTKNSDNIVVTQAVYATGGVCEIANDIDLTEFNTLIVDVEAGGDATDVILGIAVYDRSISSIGTSYSAPFANTLAHTALTYTFNGEATVDVSGINQEACIGLVLYHYTSYANSTQLTMKKAYLR